ncbi:hypothetical protein HO173_011003 [Letharia columbiana]|uniref:Uncharacterized protein n=1 Tax=Letharia columbiana TaxID=112416 RepID=A0A8H6FLT0_9LECA|nr:uncharacterized protein HO173_011003 [Letharia columbiana]KAF6230887.1 hypothetical protein HO173_011003 [Letharia columbiana]
MDHTGGTPPGTADDMIRWKDVAYTDNHLDEQGQPEVMDLRESLCKAAEMSLPTLPESYDISPSSDEVLEDLFLIRDEIFLISIQGDACVVRSFDKLVNIHLVAPFSHKRLNHKLDPLGTIL